MPDTALRQLGGRFLDALERRDTAALAACLDHDVRLQALQAAGVRACTGRAAVVDTFAGWFADPADTIEILAREVDVLGNRLSLSYRIRVASTTRTDIVEQRLYGTADEGAITTLQLLCSGFLPHNTREGARP